MGRGRRLLMPPVPDIHVGLGMRDGVAPSSEPDRLLVLALKGDALPVPPSSEEWSLLVGLPRAAPSGSK
jgi:hypothetical protein